LASEDAALALSGQAQPISLTWLESDSEQSIAPSATIIDTPTKTVTPTPELLIYYVNSAGLVNVRECGNTSCTVVTTVNRGAELQVIDDTGQYWYEIMLPDGKTGFISALLVSENPPAAQAVQPVVQPTQPPAPIRATAIPQPVVQPTQPPPPTPVPVQPTQPPQSQWNCSGDIYNCGDFASCAEIRSYFNACLGDPSKLDGNNDGRACESRCG
ncbi:MAG: SH3 domain-containing protein, partial [Anaerolineae bacterium]|nr:SH3 domain-containing protein [Anaerolineae bacterium]